MVLTGEKYLQENSNYLFIMTDLNIGSNNFSFKEIADELLSNNEWIFPRENVPQLKNFRPGDKVVLYISGLNKRYFYGYFEIATNPEIYTYNSTKQKTFYKYFSNRIKIKNIKLFENKVYFKDLKDYLDFITDKTNYGLHLRQSVKKISDKDFDYILMNLKRLNIK